MANVAHKNLTGTDLHEPKGVATATSGQVYVANGAGSGSWTSVQSMSLIETKTASASASLAFTTGINSTYDVYFFTLNALVPATDGASFKARVSTDGGSTWASGVTDYRDNRIFNSIGTSTADYVSSAGFQWSQALTSGANYALFGTVYMFNPSAATRYKVFQAKTTYFKQTSGNIEDISSSGFWIGSTGAINGVQFSMTTGNITSGSISLYGLVK